MCFYGLNDNLYHYLLVFFFILKDEKFKNDLFKKVNSLKHHISNNVFKNDDNFYYYMITIRKNNCNFSTFKNIVNNVHNKILSDIYFIDKIEIEEAIYDTNINIDDKWLGY